jgi:hypothetical protein
VLELLRYTPYAELIERRRALLAGAAER